MSARPVDRNDPLASGKYSFTSMFAAYTVPKITIEAYLARMVKFAKVSSAALVCSLVYIDRAMKASGAVYINSFTVHRMLLAAVLVACK